MIKKFLKMTASAAAVVITFSCCIFSAFAGSDNSAKGFDGDVSLSGVFDEKELFTDSQLDEINEDIQETAEKLSMNIMIYLGDSSGWSEEHTKNFADSTYDNIFGADTDGVFYYMDLSEDSDAYDYISTSGIANIYYGSKTDEMIESIFSYLPATGEPVTDTQIERGIRQILSVFEEYHDGTPGMFDYYYDSDLGKYTYYRNGQTYVTYKRPISLLLLRGALFGIIPGIIVGLCFYFITKSHYKFKSSCDPSVYVSRDETTFIVRDDRLIRTRTTKRKIESNSGGSGGGGGGGGGGGSHGGGGGHR